MQCHSQAVGCRRRCDDNKYEICHSLAVGHRKRCDETAFPRCAMSLTCYWSYERMWSIIMLAAFHKMCNVTHNLLVIGKDMIRLPFTEFWNVTHTLLVIVQDVIRLPFTKICNGTVHSHTVDHREIWLVCVFKTCNVTHSLFKVIRKDVMRLLLSECANPLPVAHIMRFPLHKMCWMSLTSCWS